MTETTTPAVRLQRTIAAPPERVYRAWLDPQVMTSWFAPDTYHCASAEVDERIGGRVGVWHVDDDGTDCGGAESEIVELVPNERISLRWNFVGPDRVVDADMTSLLTLTFAPAPEGGTILNLTHEQLDGLRARMPHVADGVQLGWESAVDHLGWVLAGANR